MKRLVLTAWLCCSLGCHKSDGPASPQIGTSESQIATQGRGIQKAKTPANYKLPPSERIFCLDIDGDGTDEALGAHGSDLWAYDLREKDATQLWLSKGKGVVHRVAAGEEQGQRYVFLARGIGRGASLGAPISLTRVMVSDGTAKKIWEAGGISE